MARRRWVLWATLAPAMALTACGGSSTQSSSKLSPDEVPTPIGRGPAYRLPALSARVIRRLPVNGLRCTRGGRHGSGLHLELYAHRLVLPLPAGIGIAPPQRRQGAYVRSGACTYPLRTHEPTGVIVLERARRLSLRDLFAIWGQPISGQRLGGFRGTVSAFVAGRHWSGPPGLIPLRHHSEIVLEVGGYVPPHPRYHFPPGL